MQSRAATLLKSLGALLGALAVAAILGGAMLSAHGAENFPHLTGRVVDQAQILSAATRASLETKLADLESKSGIQLVVATVSSLSDEEIESYANGLFRAWKLGEAKANNGVLFLIAPNQHRVRIEVGYGLEGTLTDATSSIIIANAVAPRFKAGDFDGGVARGVDDIVTVLTTDSADWQKKPDLRAEPQAASLEAAAPFLFFFIIFVFLVIMSRSRHGGLLGNAIVTSSFIGRDGGSFGGGGGFSDGGGFSGGGGSSGGGGASGSW